MNFNKLTESLETKSFSSKEDLVVDKFKQWLSKKDIKIEELSIEEVKEKLSKSHTLLPGVNIDDVVEVLKNSGFFNTPIDKSKPESTPIEEEIYKTSNEVELRGLTEVKDSKLNKILEENKFFEVLEKDVFKNDQDLDSVLETASTIGKKDNFGKIETLDYYNEFADKGLIMGGREQAQKDFTELTRLEKIFNDQKQSLDSEEIIKLEKNKKIATIVECGIAYGISDLGWYGDHISMGEVCKFVDYTYHTDKLFEVRKGEDESSFLGLGIDVTYRGLFSESYKEKFFKLLGKIKEGRQTKIKYFKNNKGEMMKEFAVPSNILYFNIDEVKDIFHKIKNINDPMVKEEFRNSPQKFKVMNQIIVQCEILSDFAEKYKNGIFRKYIDIISSIKELAWDNPEIKKILDERHDDESSRHMKFLISKFESDSNK